jgi:hypothetical protein
VSFKREALPTVAIRAYATSVGTESRSRSTQADRILPERSGNPGNRLLTGEERVPRFCDWVGHNALGQFEVWMRALSSPEADIAADDDPVLDLEVDTHTVVVLQVAKIQIPWVSRGLAKIIEAIEADGA